MQATNGYTPFPYFDSNMKTFRINIFITLLLLIFSACSTDLNDDQPPYFRVDSNTLSVKETPYKDSIFIDTNQSWNIKEKTSWITLDKNEGDGSGYLTVTVTTSTADSRIGEICITSTDETFEEIINVKQNGNTLSVITGDCISINKGSNGYIVGTNHYKYRHDFRVEFTIHGSHLASEMGIRSMNKITGNLSDGVHTCTCTAYSNSSSVTLLYKAYAKRKSDGSYVYGEEKRAKS